MSLLMEALRKAEEAKNKAEQEKASTNSAEMPVPPTPEEVKPSVVLGKTTSSSDNVAETIEFKTTPVTSPNIIEAPAPIEDISTMETIEDEAEVEIEEAKTSIDLETDNITDNVQTSQPINPDLLAEHRNRINEESELAHKQAINSLFLAKRSTQQQKFKKLGAIAALLFLFPIGGAYWYFSTSSLSTQYPIIPPNSTNTRTFLGETSDIAALTTVVETEDVQGLVDGAVASEIAQEVEPTITIIESLPELEVAQTNTPAPALTQGTISGQNINTAPSSPPALNSSITFTRTPSASEINPTLSNAYASYQNADYTTALQLYQEVLRTSQNDKDALLGLASVYLKQGETLSARNMYSRLLRLNPKDPIARTGLLTLAQATDPSRQEFELSSLLEQHPDIAPLAFALGNLYASQSRWSEAQGAYFTASASAKTNSIGPINPDYPFNLAVSLEQLNQPGPAYTYYLEALELSRYSTPSFELDLLTNRLEYLEQALP